MAERQKHSLPPHPKWCPFEINQGIKNTNTEKHGKLPSRFHPFAKRTSHDLKSSHCMSPATPTLGREQHRKFWMGFLMGKHTVPDSQIEIRSLLKSPDNLSNTSLKEAIGKNRVRSQDSENYIDPMRAGDLRPTLQPLHLQNGDTARWAKLRNAGRWSCSPTEALIHRKDHPVWRIWIPTIFSQTDFFSCYHISKMKM